MRQSLQLFINGQPTVVRGEQAFWPLSRYLREHRRLVGTKIVCAEGDCGACSVLVGRPKQTARDNNPSLSYQTIDSCIVFMHQLDRTHVVTVEGIASREGELSAVQKAMVEGHGSQCGFCTPGFVVALHGAHEDQIGLPQPSSLPDMEEDDLKVELSGNLCRCTGYVQILAAARRIDATTIGGMNGRYPAAAIVDHFESLGEDPVTIECGDERDGFGGDSPAVSNRVFVARTIEQAIHFRAEHPTCRVVSGATDVGVQHNHGHAIGQVLLGIADVEAMREITVTDDSVRFGAAATWRDVLKTVESTFPTFDPILLRFGSPQIRNIGSIGGNLANGSPIADSIPFLMSAGASIELSSIDGTRLIAMDEFYTGYKTTVMRENELITAVVVPRVAPEEELRLYKVSRRRDMDISTLTAGIFLRFENSESNRPIAECPIAECRIAECRIAIGGVGPVVIRCRSAEQFLVGRPLELQTFVAAGDHVRGDIAAITDVRGTKAFRDLLAGNVLIKCFHDINGTSSTKQTSGSPS